MILLDVDGVLADFITASLKANGLPGSHDDVESWNWFIPPGATEDEKKSMYRKFMANCDATKDFWIGLNPYWWAHPLHALCKRFDEVVFSTAPSLDPSCSSQKIQWLRNHRFMGNTNAFMIGPHKFLMAKNAILIDDSDENVGKFTEREGSAILFPQRWNSARDFVQDRIGYVRMKLEEIYGRE